MWRVRLHGPGVHMTIQTKSACMHPRCWHEKRWVEWANFFHWATPCGGTGGVLSMRMDSRVTIQDASQLIARTRIEGRAHIHMHRGESVPVLLHLNASLGAEADLVVQSVALQARTSVPCDACGQAPPMQSTRHENSTRTQSWRTCQQRVTNASALQAPQLQLSPPSKTTLVQISFAYKITWCQ